MMTYKGYTGNVTYDDDAGILFGTVDDIRDVITFLSKPVERFATLTLATNHEHNCTSAITRLLAERVSGSEWVIAQGRESAPRRLAIPGLLSLALQIAP